MLLWAITQATINGLLQGGIYALVAVGITVIFGVMKIVNFAMGEFVTLGMYMTWLLFFLTGMSAYTLIFPALILVALISWAFFRTTIKPLLGRDMTSFVLMTFGIAYFLQNALLIIFGADSLVVPSEIRTSALFIGDFVIGLPRLIAFIVALAGVFVLTFVLTKTSMGRALRATSESAEIAEMLGINSVRMFTIAFVLGGTLAGLAGVLLTPLFFVTTGTGGALTTTGLMIVVLGGLGNIKGAFIGGLIVGVVESLVMVLYAAVLGQVGIFLIFLIIIYLKPQGLFGKGARVA